MIQNPKILIYQTCQMPICSRDWNILEDIFNLFAGTSDTLDLIGGLYLFD